MTGHLALRRRGVLALMALFPVAGAFGHAAAQNASETPQERLPVEPLAIRTREGTAYFLVEMARSPAEQTKGLMFRTEVPDGTGMIFLYDPPRPVAMWMRNTPTSLDMLFIDEKGVIRKIAARTTPLSEAVIASEVPIAAVLEIKGGEAGRLGIAPGDIVHHPHFGN